MRILVADDHKLFRDGLVALLTGRLGERVEIVQASDFESCAACLTDGAAFQLALIDLNMPGLTGADGFALLVARAGKTPIAVLTASEHGGDMVSALQSGVAGYLTKNMDADEVIAAIETILAGGYFVAPGLGRATGMDHGSAPGPSANGNVRITPRQREILGLIANGLTNKEIGVRLGLSPATVKAHVTALLTIFKLKNRTQLAQVAGQTAAH